ncbi:hypothetical protein [Sphingomonas lenta]|uniref:Nuclease n=1 Tax=Sphingomonas lenta TaxID=1141887 RepID=A0A2A2SB26_9SPHN|nr:hypothetical protein [Sphingomonas lenta]PAX06504.1 hypothetical protein CKY28_17300 [Sphingomonas lenta]
MFRAASLLALSALAAPASPPIGDRWELAQLTIRQRTMVRVPRMAPPAPPRPVEWVEKKGPRCVPVGELAGALVSERDRLDLVLRGGKRVRALLEDDCRGLDFVRGFYLKPSADGMICADRDLIRTRYGTKCPIDGFRRLEVKR